MSGKIFNSCLVFLDMDDAVVLKNKIDVSSQIVDYDGVISNTLTSKVSTCFCHREVYAHWMLCIILQIHLSSKQKISFCRIYKQIQFQMHVDCLFFVCLLKHTCLSSLCIYDELLIFLHDIYFRSPIWWCLYQELASLHSEYKPLWNMAYQWCQLILLMLALQVANYWIQMALLCLVREHQLALVLEKFYP